VAYHAGTIASAGLVPLAQPEQRGDLIAVEAPIRQAGLFRSKRCSNTLTVLVVLPSASAGSWVCPFFQFSLESV
jgi:hypothetical protein